MKTDISTLPDHKQRELADIVAIIRNVCVVQKIILFGSYARGDWVEHKYDEEHYRYQSDFDILVIVKSKHHHIQERYENNMEKQISDDESIKTPVTVIVHSIKDVNNRLEQGQYFFTDIKEEGIILYDTQQYELAEAKVLATSKRKELAQHDFQYYFKEANDFNKGVLFYLKENDLRKAAFLLHQTAESLYAGILLVFTYYKPKNHDLAVLKKLANSVHHELRTILRENTPLRHRLFKLLRKAYIDARYKPSYKITKEELEALIKEVERLRKIGEKICLEKIESFK